VKGSNIPQDPFLKIRNRRILNPENIHACGRRRSYLFHFYKASEMCIVQEFIPKDNSLSKFPIWFGFGYGLKIEVDFSLDSVK